MASRRMVAMNQQNGEGSVAVSNNLEFTEPQLVYFARKHIAYEAMALANSSSALYHGAGVLAPAVRNALMESMLLHVRLLDEFLTATKRPRRNGRELDDVLARDYRPEGWKQPAGLLGQHRDSISKRVVHLSMTRTEEVEWSTTDLAATVLDELREFCDHIPHPSFRDALGDARHIADVFGAWASLADTDPATAEVFKDMPWAPALAHGS